MGWNEIYDLKTDLYKGFGNRMDSDSDKSTADALLHPYSYFVHSYYVPLCEETIAKAEYILPYSASLHKDNFYTCQFAEPAATPAALPSAEPPHAPSAPPSPAVSPLYLLWGRPNAPPSTE